MARRPEEEVALSSELTRSLGRDLSLKQCTAGYQKLQVVPKRLYRGPRGGLFYVNQRGKLVYLNGPQKERMPGVPGIIDPPGPNPDFVAGQVHESVFLRVNRQLEEAGVHV